MCKQHTRTYKIFYKILISYHCYHFVGDFHPEFVWKWSGIHGNALTTIEEMSSKHIPNKKNGFDLTGDFLSFLAIFRNICTYWAPMALMAQARTLMGP